MNKNHLFPCWWWSKTRYWRSIPLCTRNMFYSNFFYAQNRAQKTKEKSVIYEVWSMPYAFGCVMIALSNSTHVKTDGTSGIHTNGKLIVYSFACFLDFPCFLLVLRYEKQINKSSEWGTGRHIWKMLTKKIWSNVNIVITIKHKTFSCSKNQPKKNTEKKIDFISHKAI